MQFSHYHNDRQITNNAQFYNYNLTFYYQNCHKLLSTYIYICNSNFPFSTIHSIVSRFCDTNSSSNFHNSTIPQFYEFSTIPQTCNFTFAQVCTFPLISRTNMPQYHLAGFYTPAHRHNIYTQFENSICARVILPSHFTVPYLSIEKNTTTH